MFTAFILVHIQLFYLPYCFVAFFCTLKILLLCLEYLTLMPLVGFCILDANTSRILHWLNVGHAIDPWNCS